MTVEALSAWVCPTCEVSLATRFCPTCGEQRPGKHDLTLVGLFEHVLETVGHLDGRVVRSFRTLLFRPGELTDAFARGQRKHFIGPLPMFLIANLVFFALQSLTGGHVFSTTLASHLSQQFYSGYARQAVTERLAELHSTFESFAPIFDHAVAINAKSFIVLMVPPFALMTLLLLIRARKPFVVHVVFALHYFAFLLLLSCLMSLLAHPLVWLGLSGASGSIVDVGLGIVQMAFFAVYLFFATKSAYGMQGIARVATVAALVASSVAIHFGYRLTVFLITLHLTTV